MAQIKKKFIGNNQVDDTKIRLSNNGPLKARNAADSGDVNIVKVNTSDQVDFLGNQLKNLADPTLAQDAATKAYVDSASGSGANTSLSNLTTTSINQDLLPDTTDTRSLGSSSDSWLNTYTKNISSTSTDALSLQSLNQTGSTSSAAASLKTGTTVNGASGQVTIASGTPSGTGASGNISAITGGINQASSANTGNVSIGSGGQNNASAIGNTGQVSLFSGSMSSGSTGNTGQVNIATGVSHTGNSGYIFIQSGQSDSGGTTGDINILTGITSGTQGKISLNGAYTDNNSKQIKNVADPTSAQDAATKNYVDTLSQSLTWKNAVRSATTGALPAYIYANGASGVGATITANANGALPAQDGVTLVLNDRLLVKNETAGNQPYNGIYTVTQVGDGSNPFILTRATDMDLSSEFFSAACQVGPEASTQAGYGFRQNTANPITVGTTNITFINFVIGTSYTFNNGLTLSGSTVNVVPGDASLSASPGSLSVQEDPAGAIVTSGSGIKVQVESSTQKINGSNQIEGLKDNQEQITLSGTDITNQYVDLAHAVYGTSASVNSITLSVIGGLIQQKTVDYTVSLTGGSGGVTRITFAGDLATGGAAELVAGDILVIEYSYLT